MQLQDTRGEIYRGWLIVLTALEDKYFFYEIHSPEGYINRNIDFFETAVDAIASGRKDIDGVIELFSLCESNKNH